MPNITVKTGFSVNLASPLDGRSYSTYHATHTRQQRGNNRRRLIGYCLFYKMVDAAVVDVNTSTNFTDGKQFGRGSEIGISTHN